MEGEDDVVEGDGGVQAGVAGGVLGADSGGVVEGRVGDEVGSEAFLSVLAQALRGKEAENKPRTLRKGKSTVVPDVDWRRQLRMDCG